MKMRVTRVGKILRYGWYFRQHLLARLLFWPMLLLGHAILRRLPFREYTGIRVVDALSKTKEQEELFFSIFLDALKLIEQYDPFRFRRIQREVRCILNEITVNKCRAQYNRLDRRVESNFWAISDSLDPDHRDWYVAATASTIVHEAAHGVFFSHWIPYTRTNYARIERACVAEQVRFAAKLPQDKYNYARNLVRPFDVKNWESVWTTSRRQRLANAIREYRQWWSAPKPTSLPDGSGETAVKYSGLKAGAFYWKRQARDR